MDKQPKLLRMSGAAVMVTTTYQMGVNTARFGMCDAVTVDIRNHRGNASRGLQLVNGCSQPQHIAAAAEIKTASFSISRQATCRDC